jgi:hypothetical protein
MGYTELATPLSSVLIVLVRGERPAGARIVPTFHVSNLDDSVARLSKLNVKPSGPIVEMPGLARLVSIEDPDGNEIQLVQVAAVSRPPSNVALPAEKSMHEETDTGEEEAVSGDAATSCKDAAFIIGAWRSKSGDSVQEEIWTPAYDGTMYGTGRFVQGGRMTFFELLRIEQRNEDLIYLAQPGGRKPTEFKMTEKGTQSVTFTNPDHDFPKRIRYWIDEKGKLNAVVDDGTDKGKRQAFQWERLPQS